MNEELIAHGYWAAIQEEETRIADEINVILDQVRSKVSSDVFADIQDCIGTSGYVHDFRIEKTPIGQRQDDGYLFGPYFVNQTCNGGYTGDSFAGTVSIPLSSSEWIQFAYSM